VTSSEISNYSSAFVFSRVGLRTPVAARFSMVLSERGSADTTRDIRGMAVKFYTQEGNWDLASNNSPIFFIRDPFFFGRFVHAQKRNACTNLPDFNAQWDFFSLRPETMHQIVWMYSDRGIPDGKRCCIF
jgi:catalase